MRLSARVGAVEFNGRELRVAIVKTGGKKPGILEAHCARVASSQEPGADATQALTAAAAEIAGRIKHKPQVYVLCESSRHAVVRHLTVPFRGRRRVAAAVPFELEPYLAFPIDDLIVDHFVISEGAGETQTLTAGIKRAPLEEVINALESGGIPIESVNLDVAGLTSLWLVGQRKPSGLRAVLHLLDDSAVLTVVKSRTLVFFRQLSVPASLLIADPRAVSREARNTLRSFATALQNFEAVADLTITGTRGDTVWREAFEDGMTIPVRYEELGERLHGIDTLTVTFSPLDTADTVGPGAQAPADGSLEWLALAGVAVGAAGEGRAFEFRKHPMAAPSPLRGLTGKIAATVAMALVALTGFIGYAAMQYRHNNAEIERIGQEIWNLYAKSFPGDEAVAKGRPENDIGGVLSFALLEQAQKRGMTEGSRISVDMLGRPPLLTVLKEINDRLPANSVLITDVKIRDSRGSSQALTISGEIRDVQGFNTAFENLKQSSMLRIEDEPIRANKGGVTTFTIAATI